MPEPIAIPHKMKSPSFSTVIASGGDTDTMAAITGGICGAGVWRSRHTEAMARLHLRLASSGEPHRALGAALATGQ